MVRVGQFKDIPAIVLMARDFWKHTIYDDPADPETIQAMASDCIYNRLMVVLEIKGQICGFACGIKGALLGNSNVAIGTEVAWWVNPDHRAGMNGIALLKKLEELAKDHNIKYWNMAFMESSMPKEIAQIYEKMGYIKAETTYSKELNYGSSNGKCDKRGSGG